jgi:crossover junction endodeoxyribonuclease RuvC
MSVIIGIDPGLSGTGYGILEKKNSRLYHIAHGVIKTEAGVPMGIRLVHIANQLKKVIKTFAPKQAAVETLYFLKNIKSALPVAQVRGIIIYLLSEYGIEAGEYTPLQVKQAVVGRGRAEKRQIQEMLKMILGLNEIPTPDHAADALAVAFCHSNSLTVTAQYKLGR